MNCEEELKKAFLLAWIGDKREVEEIARNCLKFLSEYRGLNKKINEVLAEINHDFELPKKLRENRIRPEDILHLAFLRLSRRLALTAEIPVYEDEGIKYSVLELGNRKIVRGYCEKCKGFSYTVLKSSIGFFAQYEQLIYVEAYQGEVKDIINEIKQYIKS